MFVKDVSEIQLSVWEFFTALTLDSEDCLFTVLHLDGPIEQLRLHCAHKVEARQSVQSSKLTNFHSVSGN